jgi:hypothetical protein
MCTIEKPSKRDRASPRSFRLISLLSILGKGLERTVVRRFAHYAVQRGILTMRYFGALPARAATDLTQLFANDVEAAFAQKESISVVTFDVKGGFDTVLPN